MDAIPATHGGTTYQRRGTVNLGVYATNGVAVTAAQLNCSQILDLDISPAGGIVFEYVPATGKVKAYRQRDPAAAGGADIALPEVTNAVDLTAVVARFNAAIA
jgi:hypothetical protein